MLNPNLLLPYSRRSRIYRCVNLAAQYLFPSLGVGVTVGKVTGQQKLNPLSLKDVQMMSSKAHLTGVQQESILADIRSKWGKKVVKPGLQKALSEHNLKYAKHLRVEEEEKV